MRDDDLVDARVRQAQRLPLEGQELDGELEPQRRRLVAEDGVEEAVGGCGWVGGWRIWDQPMDSSIRCSVQCVGRAIRPYVLGSMPMYDSMGLSTKHGALVAGPGLFGAGHKCVVNQAKPAHRTPSPKKKPIMPASRGDTHPSSSTLPLRSFISWHRMASSSGRSFVRCVHTPANQLWRFSGFLCVYVCVEVWGLSDYGLVLVVKSINRATQTHHPPLQPAHKDCEGQHQHEEQRGRRLEEGGEHHRGRLRARKREMDL